MEGQKTYSLLWCVRHFRYVVMTSQSLCQRHYSLFPNKNRDMKWSPEEFQPSRTNQNGRKAAKHSSAAFPIEVWMMLVSLDIKTPPTSAWRGDHCCTVLLIYNLTHIHLTDSKHHSKNYTKCMGFVYTQLHVHTYAQRNHELFPSNRRRLLNGLIQFLFSEKKSP